MIIISKRPCCMPCTQSCSCSTYGKHCTPLHKSKSQCLTNSLWSAPSVNLTHVVSMSIVTSANRQTDIQSCQYSRSVQQSCASCIESADELCLTKMQWVGSLRCCVIPYTLKSQLKSPEFVNVAVQHCTVLAWAMSQEQRFAVTSGTSALHIAAAAVQNSHVINGVESCVSTTNATVGVVLMLLSLLTVVHQFQA